MFYDRKIKYLDYFENGERIRGGGFVKLEIRDTRLRIDLSVTGLYHTDTFERDVLFCGKKKESVGGRISIASGRGQFSKVYDSAGDIGNTGLSYEELTGIRIPLGAGREVSCVWQVSDKGDNRAEERTGRNADADRRTGTAKWPGAAGNAGAGKQTEEGRNADAGRRTGTAKWPGAAGNAGAGKQTEEGRNADADRRTGADKWTEAAGNAGAGKQTEEGRNAEAGRRTGAAKWPGAAGNTETGKRTETDSKTEKREDIKREIWAAEAGRGKAGTDGRETLSEEKTGNWRPATETAPGEEVFRAETVERPERYRPGVYDIKIQEPDGGEPDGFEWNRAPAEETYTERFGSEKAEPAEMGRGTMGTERVRPAGMGRGTMGTERARPAEMERGTMGTERARPAGMGRGTMGTERARPAEMGRGTMGTEKAEWENGDTKILEGRNSGTETYKPGKGREVRLMDDKWQQINAIYPHIRPFHDGREYISIRPADFVLFSAKSYKMVNNSFLLHGYYNYRHLILARLERKGESCYYIGVPGTFYEKEKQVAIMFGFESFECAEEPAQAGDFGYYMMRTEI